jgi:hypothetical protein
LEGTKTLFKHVPSEALLRASTKQLCSGFFCSQLTIFTRCTDPFGHILAHRHPSNISSTTRAASQNNGQKMDFLPCSTTDAARWHLDVTTALAWRAVRIENKKTRRNIFK